LDPEQRSIHFCHERTQKVRRGKQKDFFALLAFFRGYFVSDFGLRPSSFGFPLISQPGSISASSELAVTPRFNFRSAKMPIIAALSVLKDGSARRSVNPSRLQAASNSRRNTRLHTTPPEAVTQRTPKRRAARTVFLTNTSTMAD
jgi:hypothetical protein